MEPQGALEKQKQYEQQFSQPVQPAQTPTLTAAPQQDLQPHLQLVAAKLDTIKVSLDNINYRLNALEQAMHVKEEPEERPRRRRGVW